MDDQTPLERLEWQLAQQEFALSQALQEQQRALNRTHALSLLVGALWAEMGAAPETAAKAMAAVLAGDQAAARAAIAEMAAAVRRERGEQAGAA